MDKMEESNRKAMKRMFKALEKEKAIEVRSWIKKLNKSQIKKLEKAQEKHFDQINRFLKKLMVPFKMKYSKTDLMFLNWQIDFIKYDLLKIKKPKKLKAPVSNSQGDPYTCGPEYFRPRCGCSHYGDY